MTKVYIYTEAEHAQIVAALEDLHAGWLYIRSSHGDLYGVGWDRAQAKAESALATLKAKQPVEPVARVRGSGLTMLELENGGNATVFATEGMSNHSYPLYTPKD